MADSSMYATLFEWGRREQMKNTAANACEEGRRRMAAQRVYDLKVFVQRAHRKCNRHR